MRTHLAYILSLLISLAASACAPEFEHVSTEVSAVCVRGIPLWFQGEHGGATASGFQLADAGLVTDALYGSHVTLDSVTLTAGPEISDFAFASRIAIELTDSNAPAIPLIEISAAEPAQSLYAGGDPDIELSEHLFEADTGVQIEVTGAVPSTSWSALIDFCLAVDDLDVDGTPL